MAEHSGRETLRPGAVEGLPADVASDLTALVDRWSLDRTAAARLGRLLVAIADDPTAPTTVRDPHAAVEIHIADSLSGLCIDAVRSARRIADLGSGAGFPGLPLAVALPRASVALVESNARKADFMARAAAVIDARNVDVVALRAEEWRDGRLGCDVVTARALAPLAVLAEYAAPLLRMDGALVAWKGRRDRDEEARGALAAAMLGLEPEPPVAVEVGPGAAHRHLHVYRKVAETPARFPRRPGVATKRPLP